MNREKSCGAIVFRYSHGNKEVLLIQHAGGGHWSFPKGHMEPGETELETAQREIAEETGIDVVLDQTFREIVTYRPAHNVVKDVVYFVARAVTFQVRPQLEEVAQAKWIQLDAAKQLLTYANDKLLLSHAEPYLKETV